MVAGRGGGGALVARVSGALVARVRWRVVDRVRGGVVDRVSGGMVARVRGKGVGARERVGARGSAGLLLLLLLLGPAWTCRSGQGLQLKGNLIH